MSTCFRWRISQPDVHAHPHTSTSALAKRTISALIARAALRISLISISSPRSSNSLQKLYQSVTFIWSNYYVDVRLLNVSPTWRACMSPYIDFCSGTDVDRWGGDASSPLFCVGGQHRNCPPTFQFRKIAGHIAWFTTPLLKAATEN